MKKFIVTSLLLCSAAATFAGGLMTNSNQSASYARMLSRFGSTEMDAVYYNPAGLVMLKDGWNISLNNQYLAQTRTVSSNFPTLNEGSFKEYEGKTSVPFFPNVYAAYKRGNFVYSLGINPVGGGGASTFDNGLPMFELAAKAGLLAQGIPPAAYDLDMFLEGSSIYMGYQAGVSYKASDIVGLFGGVRAVQATNSYDGHLNALTKMPLGPTLPAGSTIPVMALDTKQTGFGFTPIIGINFSFTEKFNLGLRYEFETKIELENETNVNTTGIAQFDDGVKSRGDMPATLSAGAEYKVLPKLKLALGGQYYFDKGADYGETLTTGIPKSDLIDKNSWEASFGAEYNITDKILVSAGYLHFENGVSPDYQSQISHTVSTNTFGLGGAYKFNEMFTLNLGAFYSIGETFTVDEPGNYQTKYDRVNMGIGLGVDMHF